MHEKTPRSAATLPARSCAVLICSSDSRKDILERILPSILAYWSDCPYPIYVGLNSVMHEWPRVAQVTAPPSNWRRETLIQVDAIPETHLIVVLDDFLFHAPVDQGALAAFVSTAMDRQLPYLRLSPLGRSLKQRFGLGIRTSGQDAIEPIAEQRPFYSCLQIALWEKQHFISLLRLPGSIWDFEHQKIPGVRHFAISGPAPFTYRHVVEKGRWLPYAKLLFNRAGLPADLGHRPIWPAWMNLRLLMDDLRFYVFGYANH